MPISQDLRSAYKNTTYWVFEPPISIRIGSKNSALDQFMTEHQVSEWCYITAWNPESRSLNKIENNSRNKELAHHLESQNYSFFEGAGIPDSDDWQPEESFLVLGISKSNAISLAKKFRQNAVIYGEKGKTAELLVTQ